MALFNFIVLALIVGYLNNKTEYCWIAIAIVLGILSSSFSAWLCLGAVVLLWIYLKEEDNRKIRFLIMGSITLFFLLFIGVISSDAFLSLTYNSEMELLNRIAESVIQIRNGFQDTLMIGKDYSSEASRLGGGILTMKAGLSRSLLGLGIGTAYFVTGLICIFADIGLLGLVQWLRLLFKDYGRNLPWLAAIILLIPVFLCNDLYILYDVFYLLLIPVLSITLYE